MPSARQRPLSFPKSARLLRRAEFSALRRKGRSFADGPLAATWVPRPPQVTRPGMAHSSARVGLAVSSKVGDAVLRNRVKRRLREAIRQELHRLPAVDLVLMARPSCASATVDEFRAWVRRAAGRIAADAGDNT
jgi:ribonuclease P protein component